MERKSKKFSGFGTYLNNQYEIIIHNQCQSSLDLRNVIDDNKRNNEKVRRLPNFLGNGIG